eukprot:8106619-Pyramimonas_sp.AAC.1
MDGGLWHKGAALGFLLDRVHAQRRVQHLCALPNEISRGAIRLHTPNHSRVRVQGGWLSAHGANVP